MTRSGDPMTLLANDPATDGAEAVSPLDALTAHNDAVAAAVAAEFSALLEGLDLQIGPSDAQEAVAELAPEGGVHGVVATVSGSGVGQILFVVDDELLAHLQQALPPSEEVAADVAWLEGASHALEAWARDNGWTISAALPIERAAELEHLVSVGEDLLLVGAGLFHEGRHAGTVAVLGSATPPLSAAEGGSPASSGPAQPSAAPAAQATAAAEPTRVSELHALADVEMLVTAELGRTRMNVSELLTLGPGSVIELDRAAGTPIDLLVNGTLIARGEVVVVDEEYGIRLTEVVGSGEG
ncbi:MAG: flagellar motor switch protein FliN [Microthrixaceae bacterium]